jgi:hypothetical protein
MKIEERIQALENEVKLTVEEIKMILLDIRSFLSEASSPLRSKAETDKHDSKGDSAKGVVQNGC